MIQSTRSKKETPAVILIDYPGLNLRLAEQVHSMGIPVIYYISPQIWAWGGKRIKDIKERVDLMLLILPFEKEIYDRAGVENLFVGHYLLDDMELRFIRAPYNPQSDLIALLPGSRPQEIERMLPTLIKTAEILSQDGRWRFAIAGVDTGIDYERFVRNKKIPIEIQIDRTRDLIAESRLVLTSSGTATLETGIIGRPMVVIYKTGWLTNNIARNLVTLDKIALINICAGEKIVPELIQSAASAENIVSEARQILNNPDQASKIIEKLHRATDNLGESGVADRAATAIREYLRC